MAESGELIRFNYRVLDPTKAATLNDKKFEPELDDAQARVKLSIPRKHGHRVDVVIGDFRATNLVVE